MDFNIRILGTNKNWKIKNKKYAKLDGA